MIRPAGIATSVSPPKKHCITGSVLLSLSQSTLYCGDFAYHVTIKQPQNLGSDSICCFFSASCFCRLVKILQLFLQQNRLHQVQKNVPINDYLTFVTVFPILKKVQHIGLKRYFLCFFNNVLYVADS